MNQSEFCSAVNSLIETMWPTVGPHSIVQFNDNVQDPNKYTALVLCYVGNEDNAITKVLYKVWLSDAVLVYKVVAKSEWPVGV